MTPFITTSVTISFDEAEEGTNVINEMISEGYFIVGVDDYHTGANYGGESSTKTGFVLKLEKR